MEAIYLGDIELTDETLAHYGVKGMKWKYHKPKVGENASAAYKQLAAMSDKDYNDILSRIKLTKSSKGGKSATSKEKKEKTAKSSGSEKKASSDKESAEKKESNKTEKIATEKQTKSTEEKVVYKPQVDPEYVKWLEERNKETTEAKDNALRLKKDHDSAELRKKRKSMIVKKIFARM